MTGRRWIAGGLSLVTAGLLPGCGSMTRRKEPPPHATAALLDSGPSPRITAHQAGDVQFALGRSAEESDRLDQATAAYRSAILKTPRRGDIEHRLAVVLDRQGQTAEADDHFGRALKLAPKDAEILCDRGYSYYLRGRTADAETALHAALALKPDHARSHTNLGLVLASRGQIDAALAEFDRAGTDPADSRANLALALALGGHLEEASDQYARASAAKPKSLTAQLGQKGVASALKARSEPGRSGLPALPASPGPALVAAHPAGSGTASPTVDPAVRTASATIAR